MPLTEIVLKSFSIINATILTGVISIAPYNKSTGITKVETHYKNPKFEIKHKSIIYQDKEILKGNTSMFLKLDTKKRKRGPYIGIRVDLY